MEFMNNLLKQLTKPIAIIFWLSVWYILSIYFSQSMILPSPFEVGKSILKLAFLKTFWLAIFNTFVNIILGFLISILFGVLLSIFSYKYYFVKGIFSPVITLVRATPVASYIILCLILFPSKHLSIIISFLMSLPIIYVNVLKGIEKTDVSLLEMAKIFNMELFKKIKYIYFESVYPYFVSALNIAFGISIKSGVAAELIGLPKNSIGELLYESKLYFDTKTLLALTFYIVLFGYLIEKGLKVFFDIIKKKGL